MYWIVTRKERKNGSSIQIELREHTHAGSEYKFCSTIRLRDLSGPIDLSKIKRKLENLNLESEIIDTMIEGLKIKLQPLII